MMWNNKLREEVNLPVDLVLFLQPSETLMTD